MPRWAVGGTYCAGPFDLIATAVCIFTGGAGISAWFAAPDGCLVAPITVLVLRARRAVGAFPGVQDSTGGGVLVVTTGDGAVGARPRDLLLTALEVAVVPTVRAAVGAGPARKKRTSIGVLGAGGAAGCTYRACSRGVCHATVTERPVLAGGARGAVAGG